MTKLTILRGISGSGKSTWAEAMQAADPSVVIVSRDRIRMSLFSKEAFIDEDLVTKVQDAAIEAGLKAGHHVIVDDTNVTQKYVKRIADIGHRLGVKVEVKEFDVTLATALHRNFLRANAGGRNVPDEVIGKQFRRFKDSKGLVLDEPQELRPYSGTPGKPRAVMVDVDGTLAHMNGRSPFEWHRVAEDDVDDVIAEAVTALMHDYEIIIMSGRDESCRDETKTWLNHHAIPYNELFMRPANDYRKDNIVKAELFDKFVRDNWDVQFVLDDRQQVVDMWRSMGLTCLQVAPGEF